MQFRHTETSTVDTSTTIRVDAITIKTAVDQYPDLSYLDADNDPDYAAENAARLASYHDGDWHCVGIWLEAQCSYSIGGKDRRLETFQSGGLWGIESDSDKSYFAEVAREELSDLRSHCLRFGIDATSFDAAAAASGVMA